MIGSWCGHFYQIYLGKQRYRPNIKTLDIDFLIPEPRRLPPNDKSVDDLLTSLDFAADYSQSGWQRFLHPELRVEFLVPRLGPQSDKPRAIPQFKINAMPLRHTTVLTRHTIVVSDDELVVNIPHPLAFALHKLFVSTRRTDAGKAIRDREMGCRLLEALQDSDEIKVWGEVWPTFTKKEQREITQVLREQSMEGVLEIFFEQVSGDS